MRHLSSASCSQRDGSGRFQRRLTTTAGSGSTLVAAERTGRICRSIELEPRYCDITLARWEALTGQQAARAE
jgi:DNA modification methylase